VSDYPDDDQLQKIKNWLVIGDDSFLALMEYVRGLWQYADCGYWKQDGGVFTIATAGWSGNEDIISALKENTMFWLCYWQQSTRGGKYVFGVGAFS